MQDKALLKSEVETAAQTHQKQRQQLGKILAAIDNIAGMCYEADYEINHQPKKKRKQKYKATTTLKEKKTGKEGKK